MAVRFRRLFQFSLRSLLLLAVLVGLVCGVILIPLARSRRELPVIARIEKRGGRAVRSFLPTPATEFAARFLGQEPFLRVTEVSLTESGASDADLLALGRLGELRKLDLSHTYVTDDGLARLVSGLPELRELDLTLANIGPRGLAALAGNSKLETVYTLGTATEYADLEALAKKLPGVPLVEERARQEAEELGYWENDHYFSFENMGDRSEREIAELFLHLSRVPSLWRLDFGAHNRARLPFDLIARLKSLRIVHLDGSGPVDFSALTHLPELVELKVELEGPSNSDESLAPLSAMRSLRKLQLKDVLSGPQLRFLEPLTWLQSLRLESSMDLEPEDGIFGVDLEPLTKLTSLAELDLANLPVDDEALVNLANLTALRRLRLASTRVRGRGLAHLRNCQQLASLDLDETPFGDDGVAFLKDLRRLSLLSLAQTRVTDAGLRKLPAFPGPLEVRLHGTAVSPAACLEVVRSKPSLSITRYEVREDDTLEDLKWRASEEGTLEEAAARGTPIETLRLQATDAFWSGDFEQMGNLYRQARAMPSATLSDFQWIACALGLQEQWPEALATLNEANRRALAELEHPSGQGGNQDLSDKWSVYSFSLGGSISRQAYMKGMRAYSSKQVREPLAASLLIAGRVALEKLHDPPTAIDALQPILRVVGDNPELERGECECLLLLASAYEAVGSGDQAALCRERAGSKTARPPTKQPGAGTDALFTERGANPFTATLLPLPPSEGHNSVGGSVARLQNGSRLLAFNSSASGGHDRILLASQNPQGQWSPAWEFPHNSIGDTALPSLIVDDRGLVWMAYRGHAVVSIDGPRYFWLTSTLDGRLWSTPRPVRDDWRSSVDKPSFERTPDGRFQLSDEWNLATPATSPEEIRELDLAPEPIRGRTRDGRVLWWSAVSATSDANSRLHGILLGTVKFSGRSDRLYYTRSDDRRHWSPPQLLGRFPEARCPTVCSFTLRGDRAAIVYFDNDRTWLWRGKLDDNRLKMEPPVPIFLGGRGAGPLICDGDKCSLVFTREGYVPCLLEASADDVFGTSSAGQPRD